MKEGVSCPRCGFTVTLYKNPIPTVDIIISVDRGIVLIERMNLPHGWALPGGFIDYGESAEDAAVREAKEETSLDLCELQLFGIYSAPDRDPRHHTLTVVFTARAEGIPKAADDARAIAVFGREEIPRNMAFDHGKIVEDYFSSTSGV